MIIAGKIRTVAAPAPSAVTVTDNTELLKMRLNGLLAIVVSEDGRRG
jgi:hypothetical protein